MRNLCGKACTFGGDSCERRLLKCGTTSIVGHDDAETKLCEQRPPKRRVFVGFEAVHDADRACPSKSGLRCAPNRLQQILLDSDRVRGMVGAGSRLATFDRDRLRGAGFGVLVARKLEIICATAFVSADETPAMPEIGNGEKARVRTPRASGREALDGKRLKLARGNHRASRRCVQAAVGVPRRIVGSLARNQRRADRSHKMGGLGADGLHAANLLEGAQHGIGLEGAALHDDLGTQRVDSLGADDAEQRVLHHRIRDARCQVVDARADLLGVLDAGGHEHCALRPQVNRVFRGKCGVVERVRAQTQRVCGALDERPAAA